MAVLLLDRLAMGRGVQITHLNVHRLLFTSVLVASKTLDDTTFNNKYHSYVAGIDVSDLNTLERRFLNMIDYNLNVSLENFEYYRREIELSSITISQPDSIISEVISSSLFFSVSENFYRYMRTSMRRPDHQRPKNKPSGGLDPCPNQTHVPPAVGGGRGLSPPLKYSRWRRKLYRMYRNCTKNQKMYNRNCDCRIICKRPKKEKL